jgi:hypothetical protein
MVKLLEQQNKQLAELSKALQWSGATPPHRG